MSRTNQLDGSSQNIVPVQQHILTQAIGEALRIIGKEGGAINYGSHEHPREQQIEATTQARIEETLNPEDVFAKRMRIQCEVMMEMIGAHQNQDDLNMAMMKWIEKYSVRFSIIWAQGEEKGGQDTKTIINSLESEDRISAQEELIRKMIFMREGQKIDTKMVLTWLAHYEAPFMEIWNAGDHDVESIHQKLREISGPTQLSEENNLH